VRAQSKPSINEVDDEEKGPPVESLYFTAPVRFASLQEPVEALELSTESPFLEEPVEALDWPPEEPELDWTLSEPTLISEAVCAPSCDECQCTDCCCCCDSGCGLWVQADYLYWWIRGYNAPPLVTASPPGTDVEEIGVLGLPFTTVLFGDERIGGGARSGGRIRFGNWFDCCQTRGLDVELLGFNRDTSAIFRCGHGLGSLARPFFNVDPRVNSQDNELVCVPPDPQDPSVGLDGTAIVDMSSEIYSASALWRRNLCSHHDCCSSSGSRVDLLAGYRFFRLNEGLMISEDLVVTAPGGDIAQGTSFEVIDRFDTWNEFHGGELGLAWECRRGRWSLECLAKVALGNNSRVVTIDGSTTVTVPDFDPDPRVGGLLTQTTNIGRCRDDAFAMIPEVGLKVGCEVACNLRATFGYRFLHLNQAARPGDQIDFLVNGTLLDPTTPLIGPARPAFDLVSSNVWLQGITLGLQYEY
jgi:hypothetical protein